ncbi:MAG: hypothetical protein NE330_23920, partial [Lentisphaeraceae bacterium]|nr:hypothetical protein [Lentisphaeraceae bacterium]
TWSIVSGVICALVSWIPLFQKGAELPVGRILTILALIVFAGVISCVVSAYSAFRKDFLTVLRNE